MKTSLYTTLLASLFATSTLSAPHRCGCAPPTIGIGFDLTATYGTVSAKFPNGTVLDVGRVEAPESFTTFYNSPLEAPTLTECTPYNGPLTLRKLYQGIRTFVLLGGQRPLCQTGPSLTPLTNFIGQLINLVTDTEFSTSDPAFSLPKNIIITSAHLPSVTLDRDSPWGRTVPEVEAAYRHMGWTSQASVNDATSELVLSVSYTSNSLVVKTSNFQNGFWQSENPYPEYTPNLPHELATGHCSRAARMAAVLKAKIEGALPEPGGEIQRLLLLGERSEEREFLDGLWQALQELGVNKEIMDMVQAEGYDAEFLAARGAAGMGVRDGACGDGRAVVVEVVAQEEVNKSDEVAENNDAEEEVDVEAREGV